MQVSLFFFVFEEIRKGWELHSDLFHVEKWIDDFSSSNEMQREISPDSYIKFVDRRK